MSDSIDKSGPAPTGLLPVSAGAGMVAGLALCVAALLSMTSSTSTPMPLSMAMWIVGFGDLAASFYALRRIRLAWAFSMSTNGTLAAVFLFAAPRIRDNFETSLIVALLPAIALTIITTLLAMSAADLEPAD